MAKHSIVVIFYLSSIICLILISACANEGDAEIIAKTLQERLADALPGDIIEAEPGTYPGPFEIPEGVTLKATAAGGVRLVFDETGYVVKMHSYDSPPTSLQDIDIESKASVAIMMVGNNDVMLKNIEVKCFKGFGLAAENLSGISMDTVDLVGRIDQTNSISYPIDPKVYPAIGVIFSSVADVQMQGVDISGFAGFGAIMNATSGSWASSKIADNIGVGVLLDGGNVVLNNMDISRIENCKQLNCSSSNEVYALATVGGNVLTSTNLNIIDNGGIGLFMYQSSGELADLDVSDNKKMGIWLQEVSGSGVRKGFSLKGENNTIENNLGAALVAHSSGDIEIEDTSLSTTLLYPISETELGSEDWADGIQVVNLAGDLSLKRLTMDNNERIGLLLHGKANENATITIEDLVISGGGEFGFRAQAGIERENAWDSEMDIEETLAENDVALVSDMKESSPRTTLPSVSFISEKGLIGDDGLIDDTGQLVGNHLVEQNGVIQE